MGSNSDPFDDVLNLEDQYYDQGYKQGHADGVQAGKIEGRSVGLKQGFEKFLEAGRLQSKAIVWGNRIPDVAARQTTTRAEGSHAGENENETGNQSMEADQKRLPPLTGNPRLEKNVTALYALIEPGTLSTENSDEAVNDFDDRFKRAQGKLKIIERIVGEGTEKPGASAQPQSTQTEI